MPDNEHDTIAFEAVHEPLADLTLSCADCGTRGSEAPLYDVDAVYCARHAWICCWCLERTAVLTMLDGERMCAACYCREHDVPSVLAVFRDGHEIHLLELAAGGWLAVDLTYLPADFSCKGRSIRDAVNQLHQVLVSERERLERQHAARQARAAQ